MQQGLITDFLQKKNEISMQKNPLKRTVEQIKEQSKAEADKHRNRLFFD